MQMLLLRPNGTRADGTARRVPIVRERGRKFGPVHAERCLSIKHDILVTGPNQSGKSRWLAKLADNGPAVWPGREVLHLRGLDPLQRWQEHPALEAWAVVQKKVAWAKLRAFEKVEALLAWVAAVRPVVVLDDAHKLAGRKLDLAIQICREAGRVVAGAWAENSIPMSLRLLLDKRDPQRVQLASEAAYDVTAVLMWVMIIAALMAGWWQLAAVIGGAKVLAGGRRAAKQT